MRIAAVVALGFCFLMTPPLRPLGGIEASRIPPSAHPQAGIAKESHRAAVGGAAHLPFPGSPPPPFPPPNENVGTVPGTVPTFSA